MRFRAKKPQYDEVDGEYILPVRFSTDFAHNLLGGWHPVGFGWAHLRPRKDGSYDMFVRQAALSEDMNLVRLDVVQQALMRALDLAHGILKGDEEVSDEIREAAENLVDIIRVVGD